MNLTLSPTTKVVTLTGHHGDIAARIWEGTTEEGIAVHAFIVRIGVPDSAPPEVHARFAAELREQRHPSGAVQAIPLRMII